VPTMTSSMVRLLGGVEESMATSLVKIAPL
jgi:hypothetical protein